MGKTSPQPVILGLATGAGFGRPTNVQGSHPVYLCCFHKSSEPRGSWAFTAWNSSALFSAPSKHQN